MTDVEEYMYGIAGVNTGGLYNQAGLLDSESSRSNNYSSTVQTRPARKAKPAKKPKPTKAVKRVNKNSRTSTSSSDENRPAIVVSIVFFLLALYWTAPAYGDLEWFHFIVPTIVSYIGYRLYKVIILGTVLVTAFYFFGLSNANAVEIEQSVKQSAYQVITSE